MQPAVIQQAALRWWRHTLCIGHRATRGRTFHCSSPWGPRSLAPPPPHLHHVTAPQQALSVRRWALNATSYGTRADVDPEALPPLPEFCSGCGVRLQGSEPDRVGYFQAGPRHFMHPFAPAHPAGISTRHIIARHTSPHTHSKLDSYIPPLMGPSSSIWFKHNPLLSPLPPPPPLCSQTSLLDYLQPWEQVPKNWGMDKSSIIAGEAIESEDMLEETAGEAHVEMEDTRVNTGPGEEGWTTMEINDFDLAVEDWLVMLSPLDDLSQQAPPPRCLSTPFPPSASLAHRRSPTLLMGYRPTAC